MIGKTFGNNKQDMRFCRVCFNYMELNTGRECNRNVTIFGWWGYKCPFFLCFVLLRFSSVRLNYFFYEAKNPIYRYQGVIQTFLIVLYSQFIRILIFLKAKLKMYLKRERNYFSLLFSFSLHSCLSHLPFLKSLSQRKMRLPLVTC